MEPLKNAYDRAFVEGLAAQLGEGWADLDQAAFVAAIFGQGWDELELKGRMRRIAETLDAHLPEGLDAALALVDPAVPHFRGYLALFFPDLVELRAVRELGIAGHPTIKLQAEPTRLAPEQQAADPMDRTWDTLVAALARYTPHSSSEFAVRPLLVHDQARMLAEHLAWTASPDHHVRRLASEGCRPRLPWAMALPALKRDPAPLLPILEALRFDESEYVRRSVANNLNDISKDHPDLVRELAARWLAEAEELPATRAEAHAEAATAAEPSRPPTERSPAGDSGDDTGHDSGDDTGHDQGNETSHDTGKRISDQAKTHPQPRTSSGPRSKDQAPTKATGLGTRPDDDDHGPQTASDRRRLVKHACRTLLKAGDAATMLLFGFRDPAGVEVRDLALASPAVAIGERLEFTFTLEVPPFGAAHPTAGGSAAVCARSADAQAGGTSLGRLRLEYAIHYRKKNGSRSPKVFKISEFETEEPRRTFTRRHAFRDLSTRKHHPGCHELAVIVNGVEKARVGFEVGREPGTT